jgi:hypothetical protein
MRGEAIRGEAMRGDVLDLDRAADMLWRLVRHDAPRRSVFPESDRRERGERGTGRHCNVQQTHLALAWRGAAPSLASWHLVMSGLRPHGVQGSLTFEASGEWTGRVGQ